MFDTVELLEWILLHTTLRDLAICNRVCKAWNRAIDGSSKLRLASGRSSSTTSVKLNAAMIGPGAGGGERRYWSTDLFDTEAELQPPAHLNASANDYLDQLHTRSKEGAIVSLAHVQAAFSGTDRPESRSLVSNGRVEFSFPGGANVESLRNKFMSCPPVSCIILVHSNDYESEWFYDMLISEEIQDLERNMFIINENSVTIGDIADALASMKGKYKRVMNKLLSNAHEVVRSESLLFFEHNVGIETQRRLFSRAKAKFEEGMRQNDGKTLREAQFPQGLDGESDHDAAWGFPFHKDTLQSHDVPGTFYFKLLVPPLDEADQEGLNDRVSSGK